MARTLWVAIVSNLSSLAAMIAAQAKGCNQLCSAACNLHVTKQAHMEAHMHVPGLSYSSRLYDDHALAGMFFFVVDCCLVS